MGGGGKIINQSLLCVKNNKLSDRQFQYNLIYSRLEKEARYAGFGWRSDGEGRGKFPEPKPRCLHAIKVFSKGGDATPFYFPRADEASLIPGSPPNPRRYL